MSAFEWPAATTLRQRSLAILRGSSARPLMALPVAGLLLVGLYWYAHSAPEITPPLLHQVKKSDVTVKLTRVGEVRALTSATILAEKDGPIAYLIPEGSHVKAGEVVVRFDAKQLEVALAASRVELWAAEAELQRAQQGLEEQRHRQVAELARLDADVRLAEVELTDLQKKPLPDELEKARLELEKTRVAFEHAEQKRALLPALVEKGFITRSTLDEAEVGYLAAKMSFRVAQFNLEKVSAGATREELQKAQIRLAQAEVALEKAQRASDPRRRGLEAAIEKERANVERAKNLIAKAEAELARTQLHAPRDGLVVYSTKAATSAEKIHVGMLVFAGQTLIHLPDMSTMVADTEINEIDIRKVQVETPVEARLDAYPEALFHGKVLEIGTLARTKQTRPGMPASTSKVFDVTVRIDGKDDRLKPGLTATLDIIVGRWQDVVAIPVSAVVSHAGLNAVFISKNGRLERREVVLGSSNDHTVIVTNGLEAGEWIRRDPLREAS